MRDEQQKMIKTVPLMLFDFDGTVFHCYNAEVVSETFDTVVVKVPGPDRDYLETYSKVTGQCSESSFPSDPHYVMMAAQEPVKNSFIHLPESWWKS